MSFIACLHNFKYSYINILPIQYKIILRNTVGTLNHLSQPENYQKVNFSQCVIDALFHSESILWHPCSYWDSEMRKIILLQNSPAWI